MTNQSFGPLRVVDGVTGYVCDDPADLPEAVRAADRLDPVACRDDAVLRFDVDAMVSGYESAYEGLVRPSVGSAGADSPRGLPVGRSAKWSRW
jgi:hypothetical protein